MIYIDITPLIRTNFISGIQRVVRELTVRFVDLIGKEVVLFAEQKDACSFKKINKERFLDYYCHNTGDIEHLFDKACVHIDSIGNGDLLFDLDALWVSNYYRSSLLPKLKSNGAKLAVYIYDLLPLKYPHYFDNNAVAHFANYICAWIQYGDIVITSSQSVLDDVWQYCDKLQSAYPNGYVSWLGADFHKQNNKMDIGVFENAKDAVSKGRFLLSVGTIEPRKNHRILLDALDSGIQTNIVFAGRYGWGVDEIINRIENHPLLGKNLFVIQNPNDATIDYLYKNAMMTVFASFDEGFGLPIIESLQHSTPVVASDVPILKEVGKNCCEYFNPYDVQRFVNQINTYCLDEKRYLKLCQRVKDYEEVTWDSVAEKLVSYLAQYIK